MGSVVSPWSQEASCGALQARHREVGASWVLELSGEADLASLDLLRAELARTVATNRVDAVVDVSNLTFCDAASAQLILTMWRTLPVSVSGAAGVVKRVLDLVTALHGHGLPGYHSVSKPSGEGSS